MTTTIEAPSRPGPRPGSPGAQRVSEAHRGSHDHDKQGGFAANRDRAVAAGRKGGIKVRDTKGPDFYKQIGAKGGSALKEARGRDYYAEIGRKGGRARHKTEDAVASV